VSRDLKTDRQLLKFAAHPPHMQEEWYRGVGMWSQLNDAAFNLDGIGDQGDDLHFGAPR